MPALPCQLRLRRETGTHGDVLAAVGLADLLEGVVTGVRLRSEGASLVVELPRPLDDGDLDRLPTMPGYPFVKTGPKVNVPPGAQDVVDYAAEKERVGRWLTARKAARTAGQPLDADALAAIDADRPRPDWRLIQVLNTLQGDETTNRVHAAIVGSRANTVKEVIVRRIQRIVAGDERPTDIPRWGARLVQLFTPSAAKGYASLKPDTTKRTDQTKESWADQFGEWLKYRGYFRVGCPYFHGPKSEHVRLLCPEPGDVSAGALARVADELRRVGLFGGPVKVDILASLALAEILIRHSEEFHGAEDEPFPGLAVRGRTPASVITGVVVTNYQSLGQSRSVSAMATLAVPGWFPVGDAVDAADWVAILDEHRRVIRGLNETHSDEISLLLQYRQFLEGQAAGALREFVVFVGRYGSFLLRAWEQQRRVRAFQTDHFRRVVVGLDQSLSSILEDPGFEAIALAVRNATSNAQMQKAMKAKDYREIRYDLLPELRRRSSLPGNQPLMTVVADFVSRYNAENARRIETGHRASRNVATDEFLAFTRLVERHGAAMVGLLLCAYGSCRRPRAPGAPEPPAADDGGRATGDDGDLASAEPITEEG